MHRDTWMNRGALVGAAALLTGALAAPAMGQQPTLRSLAVLAGGGTAGEAGAYRLTVAVGEPAAGRANGAAAVGGVVLDLGVVSTFRVQPCPSDFNGDGATGDIFDLFDFLAALDGGLDYNADTVPADIFDLFDFLAVLDTPCP